MNINRNNYEEFFLLYTDNELSAAERQMVEQFIRQHPDLGAELETLQQYVLQPDQDIVFSNKESLLPPAGARHHIDANNYEEWFLLYIDQELSEKDKVSVEAFVRSTPPLQQEFEKLRQARLIPDANVVFPHKETLYHYHKIIKPVMPGWWRIAAAMLCLLAGAYWLHDRTLPASLVTVAGTSGRRHADAPIARGIPKQKETTRTVLDEVFATHDGPAVSLKQAVAAPPPSHTPALVKKAITVKQQIYAIAAATNSEKDVAAGTGTRHIDPNGKMVGNWAVDKLPDMPTPDALPADNRLTDGPVTPEEMHSSRTSGVTFASDAEQGDEQVLLANIPIGKKSTFRGLFRKTSRFIEKTTASRSGQKPNIHIGSFEITIP